MPNGSTLFDHLGLAAPLLNNIKALGYERPTPIQEQAIPPILAGRDIIGSAQTGTGKTAAFALPILTKLQKGSGHTRVLVLAPTRELVLQEESAFRDFAKGTGIQVISIYGGVSYGRQTDALRKGVEVVIATPGRLLDHISKGHCKLDKIEYLVLDEADRMLDMGFMPDVKRIIRHCPAKRQTMLFSATLPPQITALAHWALKDPQTIQIGIRCSPVETVKHVVYPVTEERKSDLLLALLKRMDYKSVIIFCRTKHRVDKLAALLKREKHSAALIHSNRSQREREQALRGFREGKFELLVATDIAARGLDIPEVSHVINYDVPQHPEDYLHRIGRTGRAEVEGDAYTLMANADLPYMRAIEGYIGRKVERIKLDDCAVQEHAIFTEKDPRAATIGKVRGVRLSGGYFFGPVARKRRR